MGTAPVGVAVNMKSRLKASPGLAFEGQQRRRGFRLRNLLFPFMQMLLGRPMICQCHSRSWPMGLLSYCGQRSRTSIRKRLQA